MQFESKGHRATGMSLIKYLWHIYDTFENLVLMARHILEKKKEMK